MALSPLRAQQALAALPLASLRHDDDARRSFFATLLERLGLGPLADGSSVLQQFWAALSAVQQAGLCLWICDYVAVVCADSAVSSSDPAIHALLQPQAVLAWSSRAAGDLRERLLRLLSSSSGPSQPDEIIDLGHATSSLLAVVKAVSGAMGASPEAEDLAVTLQLLQQTAQVLQVLEVLQQQRPGKMCPLISRSASSSRLGQAGAPPRASPAHESPAAWRRRVDARRAALPGGRLFLEDLLDRLLLASPGQRQPAYPFADVLSAVESLFMTGSGGAAWAWRAKLSVLLYFLLDGGWLDGDVAPYAQGFQLPLTVVQHWRCHYLLDRSADGIAGGAEAGPAAAAALEEACRLLGAIASPSTPFRFVEALLAAGRPVTALAVQRARCAGGGGGGGSGGGGGPPASLQEAQVLLRVQLACGLLPEALSEMRRHCSQAPASKRAAHVSALVRQLASWAADEHEPDGAAAGEHQHHGLSRLQQLCQLPLDSDEEEALLSWLRQRMAAGQQDGHVLPLYLLQRGRSLEALAAYSQYLASPAAAGSGSGAGALLQRQLHTLMAAAAAALPPSLRATATATAGGGSRPVLAGLAAAADSQAADRLAGGLAAVTLAPRGAEPAVFMSPVVPAAPAGGLEVVGVGLSAAPGASGSEDGGGGGGAEPQAAGPGWQEAAAAAALPAPLGFGSLFGGEVAAEAGPGSVALGAPAERGGAGGAGADFVPLLFGTPAPAARPAFPGAAGEAGAESAAPGGPGAFTMTEAEFSRDVLGLQSGGPAGSAGSAGAGEASRRSSKRQRQTPARFQPGGR